MARFFIFFTLFFLFNRLYGQIDYDKVEYKELSPSSIDLDKDSILIIHKRYATVYLRQSDIKKYISLNKRVHHNSFHNTEKLLASKEKEYIVTDWWYDYDDQYRKDNFGDTDYKNQDWLYLRELYYIVADLVYNGKFMITKRKQIEPILNDLCIRKKHGLYGTEYVDFLLPSGKSFWNIVTRLGE